MKKVLVAMSGGVDSSVAALLLKEQGYEVIGFTAVLFGDTSAAGPCCGTSGVSSAKAVCDVLGIDHHTFDLTEVFETKVINRFISEYQLGRTPNPCSDCNRFIKFDEFFKQADNLGCEYVATGHHARIVREEKNADEQYFLKTGHDPNKDQSYFLACIPAERLRYILFPVGEMEKTDVRKLASDAGLPTATKAESQDICFLPKGTGIDQLMHFHTGSAPQPGEIKTIDGRVLGDHPGIEHFTIGQRRGLFLGGGTEGLVVHRLIPETSTVIVAQADQFPIKAIHLSDFTDMAPGYEVRDANILVKSRYRQSPWSVELRFSEHQKVVIPTSDVYSVATGQWLVGFDNDLVLFGGIIDSVDYD